MATTPMLSPDGIPGDVPNERVADAIKAGFNVGAELTSPDGKQGIVPMNRVHDAIHAGFMLKGSQPSAPAPIQMQSNKTLGTRMMGGPSNTPGIVDPYAKVPKKPQGVGQPYNAGGKVPQSIQNSPDYVGESIAGMTALGALGANPVASAAVRKITPAIVGGAKAGAGFAATEAVVQGAKKLPFLGEYVSKIPGIDYLPFLVGMGGTAKEGAPPREGVEPPEVYRAGYRQPRAYYGGQPPEPIPQRSGLQLPGEVQRPIEGEYLQTPESPAGGPRQAPAEVVQPKRLPQSASVARDLPYRRGPGEVAAEDVSAPDPRILAGRQGVRTTPIAQLPENAESQIRQKLNLAPADTSKKAVGSLLEKGLDAAPPPEPGKPIYQGAKPAAAAIEHTPVQSSALKSFAYDPAQKELHIATNSNPNTVYVYGDVAPEQANALATAESKGKSYAEFRKSGSPLVAKIIDGKRVAVKPTVRPQGEPTATPDNQLVEMLKKSVAQAKGMAAD